MKGRVLVASLSALLLSVSFPEAALAAGGEVKLITDDTGDGYFYALSGSGVDRFIGEYLPSDFAPGSILCGIRGAERNTGNPPLGVMGYEVRVEDPTLPGYPDLSPAGLVTTADPATLGSCFPIGGGPRFVSFGQGGGVPYAGGKAYACAIEPPHGTGVIDMCGIRLDTSSAPQGRSKTWSAGVFGMIPWNHFVELIVFEPRIVDLSMRAHGSARFAGDTGRSIVYTRRSHAGPGPTDDAITLTLVLDVVPGAGPITRNVAICADQTPLGMAGSRAITGYFASVGSGAPFDGNDRVFPDGRTVLRLEVRSVAVKTQVASIVDARGPIDLPIRVLADDPAVDDDPCRLESLQEDLVDFESRVLGLRRRPMMADNETADAFLTVQAINADGDAFNVRASALDMPRVDYVITGLEVTGGELGGSGLPGFDALELRDEDPIAVGYPDLTAGGLIVSVGADDGLGDVPTGPPQTTVRVDTPDVPVTVAGSDPLLLANRFVRALLLPGESLPGPITAIGAQQSPTDTLLGDSSSTISGLNPGLADPTSNVMLRILTDGEGGTLDSTATRRITKPNGAPGRPVGRDVLIDRGGNRID